MNSSFPNRWSFSYLKFTKYVTNIIAEPKYKYGQREQVTVRNHNRWSTSLHPVLQNTLTNITYYMTPKYDFCERRSCETQLIQLVEDLARNLTSGIQTDLILLDFSKAFDKASHLNFLYKFRMHGIEGNTLMGIMSFLIGRSQTVVLEGVSSEELSVT